jgi:hypothetical protein
MSCFCHTDMYPHGLRSLSPGRVLTAILFGRPSSRDAGFADSTEAVAYAMWAKATTAKVTPYQAVGEMHCCVNVLLYLHAHFCCVCKRHCNISTHISSVQATALMSVGMLQ